MDATKFIRAHLVFRELIAADRQISIRNKKHSDPNGILVTCYAATKVKFSTFLLLT